MFLTHKPKLFSFKGTKSLLEQAILKANGDVDFDFWGVCLMKNNFLKIIFQIFMCFFY
jgi:hypothetical protein